MGVLHRKGRAASRHGALPMSRPTTAWSTIACMRIEPQPRKEIDDEPSAVENRMITVCCMSVGRAPSFDETQGASCCVCGARHDTIAIRAGSDGERPRTRLRRKTAITNALSGRDLAIGLLVQAPTAPMPTVAPMVTPRYISAPTVVAPGVRIGQLRSSLHQPSTLLMSSHRWMMCSSRRRQGTRSG